MRNIALSFALVSGLIALTTAQTPPSVVNYQGRVTRANGQPLPDGTVKVEVNIYDSPSAGTLLWDSGERTVNVRGGVFALALQGNGATKPTLGPATFASGFTWFEVVIWDGNTRRPLSPRQLLAGVPWSLWASTVSDGAVTTQKLANDAVTADKLKFPFSRTVNNALAGEQAFRINNSGDGVAIFGSSVNYIGIQGTSTGAGLYSQGVRGSHEESGNVGILGGAGFGVYGLSASNYAGKFDGAVDITSKLTVGGNLGLGITDPQSRLDVNGSSRFSGPIGVGMMPVGSGPEVQLKGTVRFYNPVNSNETMSITAGDVYESAINVRGDNNTYGRLITYTSRVDLGGGRYPEKGVFTGGDLTVGQDVRAVNFLNNSSKRFKTNIQRIASPLERLLRIRAIQYDWKKGHGNGRGIGVLAEDVAKEFPELVGRDRQTGAVDSVDYGHLASISIEAIRELKSQNDDLRHDLDQERTQREMLEARLASLEKRFAKAGK